MMLECIGLNKGYGGTKAVTDLSFSLGEGEVLGLLGANGAGKTTTIKMVLGLARPDSGEVRIRKGASVGYSPETPYFHPFLTGYEVMLFYSRLQGIRRKAAEDQIRRLLKLTGLAGPSSGRRVRDYSKGMLQRLAFAQALIGDPRLLVLDEPTSGMDALGRLEMLGYIREMKHAGKTIIFNSHILSDVERTADRVVILKEGIKIREVDLREGLPEGRLEEIFIGIMGGSMVGNMVGNKVVNMGENMVGRCGHVGSCHQYIE